MTDFEDASVNENGQPLGNTPESPTPPDTAHAPDGLPVEVPAPAVAAPEPALFGWGAPAVPEPPIEPAPASPTPPVEPSPAFESPVVEPTPVFDTPVVIPEPSFEFVPEPAIVEPEAPPAPVIPDPPALEVPPAPVAPASEVAPETTEPSALEAVVPVVAAARVAEAVPAGFSDGLTGELRALTEELEPPTGVAVPAADETAELPAVAGDSLDDIAPGTVAIEGEQVAEAPAAEGAVPAEGEAAEGTEVAAEGEAAAEGAEGTAAAAVAEGDETALEGVVGPRTKVSWWPFVGYIVVWLGAAGYAVWQLQQLPVGQAAYETNLYTMSMLGGLVLLAVGPVLLLIVWLASWIGRENRRIGLMFISALLKGALATLIGAMIWIGALMLVDYLRLGRPF